MSFLYKIYEFYLDVEMTSQVRDMDTKWNELNTVESAHSQVGL